MRYGALACFARDWLGREVDAARWCYHSLWHTLRVVADVEAFGRAAGLPEEQLELLKAAAMLHDTGYGINPADHESASACFARRILPDFGASPEQTALISALILATRMPYEPVGELEALLCDADLGVLGAGDFEQGAQLLRRELAAGGKSFSDREWCEFEYRFLSQVEYFTAAARSLRGAGLIRNREAMRRAAQPEEAER